MSHRPEVQSDRAPDERPGGSAPSLVPFFALVCALSVPFYALGWLTRIELLPGLPISAFAAVVPAVAALILSRREASSAARAPLRNTLDLRVLFQGPALAVAILLAPAAEWTSYLLPSAIASSVHITPLSSVQLAVLAAAFLAAAIGEELGWSGYALGRLRRRAPMLRVGLEIGVAWAAWHVVPLVSVGRSAEWVAWWSLATIAQRIVFVWLYRASGGSVGAVALSHALRNLVWMLIPFLGSGYSPRADAVATVVVAAAVVAISGAVFRVPAAMSDSRKKA